MNIENSVRNSHINQYLIYGKSPSSVDIPVINAYSSDASNSTKASSSKDDNMDIDVKMKNKTEKIDCQTCRNRKYVDGSDDPGVSFKTPGHIAPEVSGAQVMAHELEHVRNETAKAHANNRRVVSQTVTLHTSICPECGKVYVSGGLTRTTTASNQQKEKDDYFTKNYKDTMLKNFGAVIDTKV